MVLRTVGRYALKVRNDVEYNGAGHFLGLDDGAFPKLLGDVADEFSAQFDGGGELLLYERME